MECWNIGMVNYWETKNKLVGLFFFSIHYSIIPFFHHSVAQLLQYSFTPNGLSVAFGVSPIAIFYIEFIMLSNLEW
jgi:hypothetical protein